MSTDTLKQLSYAGLLFLLTACAQSKTDTAILQARVDSLQKRLDSAYAPGLGEFMSGIQVHHAKLWFAGQSQNWKLAKFEIGEIREALDAIRKYCTDRPEVTSLPMILPPLDSLDKAIKTGNAPAFKSGFIFLTNTCNNCHKTTQHEFNVIQVPQSPPLTNQVFTRQP